MTQEDRELLIRDLYARLPYGVKLAFHSNKGDIPATFTNVDMVNEIVSYKPDGSTITYCNFIELSKPYLRPMSSMTEDEKKEFHSIPMDISDGQENEGRETGIILHYSQTDWLNAHHFDYRGLIEKGLALEKP